ncbi:HD domain-containing protein [Mesorhizobium sp. BAC0120]|uniref:HD domain-containing protein n=1 Tax=Mesorhizobium sp. BAC0120 TaxID=3090670 RepID=UPI00298C7C0A|nr:HD domain-containing protein [Mesorhizobium sp. BAC0120]MDW6023614.1 HD domain-containing protein [Mesorhizobium sp. BAC0120]
MSNLSNAVDIAAQAHDGQIDKLGEPYFEHCRRVAEAVETLDEKIVAYLHDVIEKGAGWNRLRLRQEAGFSPVVISAVDALTRRAGEGDDDFVRRAASNPLARNVKRADLLDNRRQAIAAGRSSAKYDEGLAVLANEFGL